MASRPADDCVHCQACGARPMRRLNDDYIKLSVGGKIAADHSVDRWWKILRGYFVASFAESAPRDDEFMHVFRSSRLAAMLMQAEVLLGTLSRGPVMAAMGVRGYEVPDYLFYRTIRWTKDNVFATVASERTGRAQLASVKFGWGLLLRSGYHGGVGCGVKPRENIEAMLDNLFKNMIRVCDQMHAGSGGRAMLLGGGFAEVRRLQGEARSMGLNV
jgi:hypothetical protein